MKNLLMESTSKKILVARAEASAWITHLHGPHRSKEMEEGFQRWLAERPENAQEFEGLTEVWDLVAAGAPTRGVPRLERWEHTAEAQELKALRERKRRPLNWRIGLATAAVLAVCGVISWRLWPTTTYLTAVGEQRVIQLPDGSTVSLNSDSELKVDYDDTIRLAKLRHGEALFQVAKDPGRPFAVVAGNSRVTALGTAFVVRQEADRTAVTLVEGKVSVSGAAREVAIEKNASPTPASKGSDTVVLSPGQRLTLVPRKAPAVDAPQLDQVTAWRRGEVVLADTPLADAVKEMNRYDKTRIVIGSSGIEGLSVSGLYHTGDSEGFAQSIARMYGLQLIERDGVIQLER